jgi:hypothetical protein
VPVGTNNSEVPLAHRLKRGHLLGENYQVDIRKMLFTYLTSNFSLLPTCSQIHFRLPI